MPTVTATIDEVKALATGMNKHGKPWALLGVTAGGTQYTTFDAEWHKRIGQEHTFEFESATREKGGKTYTDLRILEPKKRGNGGGEEVLTAIAAVLERLSEIERKLDRALDQVPF